MRRGWLAAVAGVFLTGACGVPTQSSADLLAVEELPPGLQPGVTSVTATTIPDELPSFDVDVWLVRRGDEEAGTRTQLAPTSRTVTEATVQAALEALVTRGPTEQDVEAGLTSQFDPDLETDEPITVSAVPSAANPRILLVDISQPPAGAAQSNELYAAQIVFTSVGFPGVDAVVLLVAGAQVEVATPTAGSLEAGTRLTTLDFETYDPAFVPPPTTTAPPTTLPPPTTQPPATQPVPATAPPATAAP